MYIDGVSELDHIRKKDMKEPASSDFGGHLFMSYCNYCGEYVFLTNYPLQKLSQRKTDGAKIICPNLVYRGRLKIAKKNLVIKFATQNNEHPKYESRRMHLCKKCELPVCYEVVEQKSKENAVNSDSSVISKITISRPNPIYVLSDAVFCKPNTNINLSLVQKEDVSHAES